MTTRLGFFATGGFVAVLLLATPVAGWAQARDAGELHAALHLSLQQETAWRAYQTALEPDPGAQARHQSAQAMMAALPTPRRIDLLNANMEADLELMHRQGEAAKAFYATLTPEQQKVFDRETLPAPDAGEDR